MKIFFFWLGWRYLGVHYKLMRYHPHLYIVCFITFMDISNAIFFGKFYKNFGFGRPLPGWDKIQPCSKNFGLGTPLTVNNEV